MITENQAAANAFVLERTAQIERYINKFQGRLPAEEYHQEVYYQIIRRHHTLRLHDAKSPESVISTWLGWQCRAARKTVLRRFDKHQAGRVVDSADTLSRIATTPSAAGSADRVHYAQEVRELLRYADKRERLAVICVLNDWTEYELREHVGISIADRDTALRSLAAKVNRRGNDKEEVRPSAC